MSDLANALLLRFTTMAEVVLFVFQAKTRALSPRRGGQHKKEKYGDFDCVHKPFLSSKAASWLLSVVFDGLYPPKLAHFRPLALFHYKFNSLGGIPAQWGSATPAAMRLDPLAGVEQDLVRVAQLEFLSLKT